MDDKPKARCPNGRCGAKLTVANKRYTRMTVVQARRRAAARIINPVKKGDHGRSIFKIPESHD